MVACSLKMKSTSDAHKLKAPREGKKSVFRTIIKLGNRQNLVKSFVTFVIKSQLLLNVVLVKFCKTALPV